MKPALVSSVLALLSLPALAQAQVDPARVFYAVAFTHGSPHTGVITAQGIESPFAVVAAAARGTVNGAITLDPVRSLLYGGSCCTPNLPIQAYDPSTLLRVPSRDITVPSSGSLSLEVDAPRRVLFHYDTVTRSLRAISLAEGSAYGTVLDTTTLTDLPAEAVPTTVGDQLAVDTRGQRLIVTGGDGGPVLAVDVSRITAGAGSFGAITDTGQRNRRTGNSGGAVAINEVGRQVFFIPATGTVRVFNADPPFAVVRDLTIPAMAGNDCGLAFDGRTNNLYVGRGSATPPVVVNVETMAVTPFATGPGEVVALSFAGGTTRCVDRDGDGFAPAACAAMGARVDCDDGDAAINPEAPEACNGRDDDCDDLSDEGFCRIEGMCFRAGQANPANACQVCLASAEVAARTSWSPAAAGTTCRLAAGACDLPESCDGQGAACPEDRFASSTTVCRVAADLCDLAETCTGAGAACPADGFRPAGEVCRPSVNTVSCDPAETCSGSSLRCPEDLVTRAPTTEVCNAIDDDCDGMVDEPPCQPAPPMPDGGGADVALDVPAATIDAAAVDAAAVDVAIIDVAAVDVAAVDVAAVDVAAVDLAASPDLPAAVDAAVANDAVVSDVMKATDVTVAQDVPSTPGPSAGASEGCGCAVPGVRGLRHGLALALVALAMVGRRRRR